MKWGIVDNYQQPKRSYRYVQRAYQPLLVNLQFDRRRWKQDEPFLGQLWIVNDTYQEYKDCKIKLVVTDEQDAQLHEQSIDVASIGTDSSKSITDISWDIAKQVNQQFQVSLSLLDSGGKEISQNEYLLLIGDQAAARKQMKAMGQAQAESNKAFTYGNYYRFFPDMIQQKDRDWQGQTQTPRAESFSPQQ